MLSVQLKWKCHLKKKDKSASYFHFAFKTLPQVKFRGGMKSDKSWWQPFGILMLSAQRKLSQSTSIIIFHFFTANAQKCFMKLLFVLIEKREWWKGTNFCKSIRSKVKCREKLGKVEVFPLIELPKCKTFLLEMI